MPSILPDLGTFIHRFAGDCPVPLTTVMEVSALENRTDRRSMSGPVKLADTVRFAGTIDFFPPHQIWNQLSSTIEPHQAEILDRILTGESGQKAFLPIRLPLSLVVRCQRVQTAIPTRETFTPLCVDSLINKQDVPSSTALLAYRALISRIREEISESRNLVRQLLDQDSFIRTLTTSLAEKREQSLQATAYQHARFAGPIEGTRDGFCVEIGVTPSLDRFRRFRNERCRTYVEYLGHIYALLSKQLESQGVIAQLESPQEQLKRCVVGHVLWVEDEQSLCLSIQSPDLSFSNIDHTDL